MAERDGSSCGLFHLRGEGDRTMSLRAEQVKAATVSMTACESVIREHLQIIDSKIQQGTRTLGRNVLSLELPQSFGVSGLEKKDQQMLVYSKIIESLEKRGFTVGITLSEKKTTLHVAYEVKFSEEQRNAMKALVKDKLIHNEEELNDFIKGVARWEFSSNKPTKPN